MAEDEARFGLINWHKRRYCPQGQRPPCIIQRKYEWTWFYAAVEPMTGESFCLYLPRLDGDCYEFFLKALSHAYPNDLILLIRDNAPAHIKKDIDQPDNIITIPFLSYSPELNPVERWFQEFRKALSNKVFKTIDLIHDAITDTLNSFTNDKERLELLTNFPWWWFAISQLVLL